MSSRSFGKPSIKNKIFEVSAIFLGYAHLAPNSIRPSAFDLVLLKTDN